MNNVIKFKYSKHMLYFGLSIVLVIALILLFANRGFDDSSSNLTRIQLKLLKEDLIRFKTFCEYFPSEEQGFQAFVEAPCLKISELGSQQGFNFEYKNIEHLLRDHWGNRINYVVIEDHAFLISLGADGLKGGDGENEDIQLQVY